MDKVNNARRYLVVTELFLPTKGGTAVWFDEVYRRLGDQHTHIVTQAVPDAAEHDAAHPNTVHRIRLEDSTWMRPASLPRYLALFTRVLWLAVTQPFDSIHAGRVLPEGLVALSVAKLTRRRCVIYAHGEEITTWSRLPRRKRAMALAYRHASRVIANSEFTRQQLLQLGVPEEKIVIISPGVDTARFRPGYETLDLRQRVGCEDGDKLVLSVGRLSRRKGFDNLMRALASLHKSNGVCFRYALIGIGEDQAYLEEVAQTQGIVNRVHFLGHVPMEELPRWYCSCDVFAMPNREINGDTEGFGMVFLEAAASGKPVIAGKAGGTGDAVFDGETGIRVDGTDPDAIGTALASIFSDSKLAGNLGQSAFERATREFDWTHVAKRISELEDDGLSDR